MAFVLLAVIFAVGLMVIVVPLNHVLPLPEIAENFPVTATLPFTIRVSCVLLPNTVMP